MRSCLILILFLPLFCNAQPVSQPDAAEIQLKLKKLGFLGSVLYMAAHPDDENTNIIAYLSNYRLATTAYLSLTRGDGGQNLIGPEIRERLGLIRTQELLAARRIDGGKQFFTRAIDFGFSKSATEAFSIWGRDAVLHDATRVIRKFKPDVIITRFPPDERAGHGHHTASAIVAGEVFDMAAKSDAYPEQVKEFGTWQVRRLYTNTGRWWNDTVNENTPGVITLDVGGYNQLLGKSYSEISALSSSQHRSQGWGRRGERGYRPEFLEYIKGAPAERDIFEGIDTSWKRVKGGALIDDLIQSAVAAFNPTDPAASVPALLRIQDEISKLDDSVWKERKLAETEELIVDCLGLYAEATASHYHVAPGEEVGATVEVLNRSRLPIRLTSIRVQGLVWDSTATAELHTNKPAYIRFQAKVSADAGYSDPYWLREPHSTGLYTVKDPTIIGAPESSPAVTFVVDVEVAGKVVSVRRPFIYKWVDPVKGELWRPFAVVPPASVTASEDVMVFGKQEPRQVNLLLRSSSDRSLSGTLTLSLPDGWKAQPASLTFKLAERGAEQRVAVTVYPPAGSSAGSIKAVLKIGDREYDRSLQMIAYDHFPIQTLLPPAEVKVVRIDLKTEGERIAYIRGAGDDIPAALRNMGYSVVEMNNGDITLENLRGYDAVVLGVRALNTNDRARYFMPVVLEYAKGGGTVVVQYNTNSRMYADEFAPFPISISRGRVTDETSEVKILRPDHPVVNVPNRLAKSDFDGWVQERGLYFPGEWDERFEPILSMKDPGEQKEFEGSLLVARYGNGYYVYTGLSFFRQLPEGVPGAYKLFANIVSLGKSGASNAQKKAERTKGRK